MIPHIKWVDRETAARDLLAVANQHESLEIRQAALRALRGIRSPIIANDLIKIALDTGRDEVERLYALYVFTDLPGNIFAPQWADLLEESFNNRTEAFKKYDIETPFEVLGFSIENDFAVYIFKMVNSHPSNRRWFFQLVDQLPPVVSCHFYCETCTYAMYDQDWATEIVLDKVICLVEANPELMDLYIADTVFNNGSEKHKDWLQQYIDRIADMCTGEDFDWIPSNWDALWDVLKIKKPILYRIYAERQARLDLYGSLYGTESNAYRQTVIWQRLESIYTHTDGAAAIEYFWHVASDTSQHVIVRAAATYFLGKFYRHEQVIEKLCHLLLTGDAIWEEYFEPIRYEAGDALQYSNSPQAWETMTRSFFVIRNNELWLDDWYPHLTDRLCGVHGATQSRWVEESSYRRFGKLPEIEATLPPFP